jgi:hypothetical protein
MSRRSLKLVFFIVGAFILHNFLTCKSYGSW